MFTIHIHENIDACLLICFFIAQTVGGILAGALNLLLFRNFFAWHEHSSGVKRSKNIVTASCFGEYFPNPGVVR